jgi:N4-gp56 family major capsid protein
MPDVLTTTRDIEPGMQLYYDRILATPLPQYVHTIGAMQVPLPSKSTKTWKARRYNRKDAATTPIPEGLPPRAQKPSYVDIMATVDQYGGWDIITDVVTLTDPDPVLTKTVELQNDQQANTIDQLMRDILAASASVTTCYHGSGAETNLNRTDIDAVVTTLVGGLAQFVTDMIKAGTGQGTAPIPAAYMSIFDYHVLSDLEAVEGFKPVHMYATQNVFHQSEWGAVGRIRCLYSTQGYYDGSTYYYAPIFGKEAYAEVPLEGGNISSIITPDQGPLHQQNWVAWKRMWVGRILQDLHIVNLKFTKKA